MTVTLEPGKDGEPLEPSRQLASSTDLTTLAVARCARPLTRLESLRGGFWPEDENAGEFEVALREWRDEAEAPHP